jgi:hypothetical protein
MTEPVTMRAFHADDRTRDWRVVGDGATAVFRTGSFAAWRADGPRRVADMVDARRRRGQRGRRHLGDRPRLTGTRPVVLTLRRKRVEFRHS